MEKIHKTVKKRNKAYLAIYALGFLVLLLVFGKSLSILSSFAHPFSANLTHDKQFSWNGQSSVNLAFINLKYVGKEDLDSLHPGIAIVNFQPKDKKITVLHVSNLIYTEVPRGFGEWKIGSVYELGQEEKPPIGPSLIKASLSKLIALPIDGLVLVSSDTKNIENEIKSWRSNPLNLGFFLTHIQTDLTPFESIHLFWAFSEVRDDKIDSLDLGQSNITESKLLPDSTRVLGVSMVRLDTFVRDNLSDISISDENISIGVFNAINHPGLANEVARILTNLGGNVVIISNTEQKTATTAVISSGQSITFNRLSQMLAPHCLTKPCQSADPRVTNSRAEINVVIGEDYYQYWNKR